MKEPSIARLRELFDLDAETGVLRWRVSRGPIRAGQIAGCKADKGYLLVRIDGRLFKVHRVIFAMVSGAWPSKYLDHINGVRDDNRPCNLREASNAENLWNRGAQKNNTSGFKGVSWFAPARLWQGQCRVNGRPNHLGYFKTPEEADAAVRSFREKHHGEFARHE